MQPMLYSSAVGVVLLLSACATSHTAVLGVWLESGRASSVRTIEFFEGGALRMVDEHLTEEAFGEVSQETGTYEWVDEARMTVDLDGLASVAGATLMTVSIAADDLTLTQPDGTALSFQRAHGETSPLAARRAPGGIEARIVRALTAINSGQGVFAAACSSGFYAPSLAVLERPPRSGGPGFIPSNLIRDSDVEQRYRFVLTAGSPVRSPMSCNMAAAGTGVEMYFVAAFPRAGQPGHYFGTNHHGGPIYWSDVEIPVTLEGAPPDANPILR